MDTTTTNNDTEDGREAPFEGPVPDDRTSEWGPVVDLGRQAVRLFPLQLSDFARRGFLVVRNAMSLDDLRPMLDEAKRTETFDAGRPPTGRMWTTKDVDSKEGRHHFLKGGLLHGIIMQILQNPPAGNFATQYAFQWQSEPNEPDYRHIDGGYPAGLPGMTSYKLMVGVLLTEVKGHEDGALRVWPGSHLDALYRYRQLTSPTVDAVVKGDLEVYGQGCLITGAIGTVVICHPLLLHGISPRTKEGCRIVAYTRLHYQPERAGSPAERFPSFETPWAGLTVEVENAGRGAERQRQ